MLFKCLSIIFLKINVEGADTIILPGRSRHHFLLTEKSPHTEFFTLGYLFLIYDCDLLANLCFE